MPPTPVPASASARDDAVLDREPFPPWLLNHCPILAGIQRNPAYAAFDNYRAAKSRRSGTLLACGGVAVVIGVAALMPADRMAAFAGTGLPIAVGVAIFLVSAALNFRWPLAALPPGVSACFPRIPDGGTRRVERYRAFKLDLFLTPIRAEEYLQAIVAELLESWRALIPAAIFLSVGLAGIAAEMLARQANSASWVSLLAFWGATAIAVSFHALLGLEAFAVVQAMESLRCVLLPLRHSRTPYGAWLRGRAGIDSLKVSLAVVSVSVLCGILGTILILAWELALPHLFDRLSPIPWSDDATIGLLAFCAILWLAWGVHRVPVRRARNLRRFSALAKPLTPGVALVRRHLAGDEIEIAELEVVYREIQRHFSIAGRFRIPPGEEVP